MRILLYKNVCPGKNYWTVAWTEGGKRREENFSIDEYGEDGAYKLAVEFMYKKK